MRNTPEDIIAITQAALDGKEIEVLIGETSWSTHVGLRFDWGKYIYRVKPPDNDLTLGGWRFHELSGYGVGVYRDGAFIANLSSEGIDDLHTFAQKARGIESPQYKEPDISQRYSTSVNPHYDAGYLAGYKMGWNDYHQALGGK
jgi:hypothetical protein